MVILFNWADKIEDFEVHRTPQESIDNVQRQNHLGVVVERAHEPNFLDVLEQGHAHQAVNGEQDGTDDFKAVERTGVLHQLLTLAGQFVLAALGVLIVEGCRGGPYTGIQDDKRREEHVVERDHLQLEAILVEFLILRCLLSFADLLVLEGEAGAG